MSSTDLQTTEADDPRITILASILEVLRGGSDSLSQNPVVIWQQVYETLQGKGAPTTPCLAESAQNTAP